MTTRSLVAAVALLVPGSALGAELPGQPTGDVLLRFAVEPTAAALDRLAAAHGARVERLPGAWPVFLLDDPKVDPAELSATLEARADVTWAYPDLVVQTELHSLPLNDTYVDELWHLENVGQNQGALPGMDINVLPAWEITNGAGVLIAIIDGGVEEHPDLLTVQPGIDILDGDGDASPGAEQDNPGHGTCVAGVAAAIGDNGIGVAGVAWGAQVLPVRLVGGGASLSEMYGAFVNAVDRGADVLNNSWGFNTEEPCAPISDLPPLNEAMAYAQFEGRDGLGTVVVFSAGNSGCEQNEYPMLRDNEGVIAVGSINDRARKWGYSVWGNHVDVGAPSGGLGGGGRPGLWSTDMFGDPGFNGAGDNNDYTNRMGGTSGAAPVVSGVVALMLAANPRLTEADVRDVLCATANKVDPSATTYDETGWSPYFGCGRVDAGAAVVAVANSAPLPPTLLTPSSGGSMPWDAASFTWSTGEDPDGDSLRWWLELTPIDVVVPPPLDEQGVVLRAGLDTPAYRLGGLRWATGTWEARVAASDQWGRGEWSEPVEFILVDPVPVQEPVEEEEGCQSALAPGPPSSLLGLLCVFGAMTRRRPA